MKKEPFCLCGRQDTGVRGAATRPAAATSARLARAGRRRAWSAPARRPGGRASRSRAGPPGGGTGPRDSAERNSPSSVSSGRLEASFRSNCPASCSGPQHLPPQLLVSLQVLRAEPALRQSVGENLGGDARGEQTRSTRRRPSSSSLARRRPRRRAPRSAKVGWRGAAGIGCRHTEPFSERLRLRRRGRGGRPAAAPAWASRG